MDARNVWFYFLVLCPSQPVPAQMRLALQGKNKFSVIIQLLRFPHFFKCLIFWSLPDRVSVGG